MPRLAALPELVGRCSELLCLTFFPARCLKNSWILVYFFPLSVTVIVDFWFCFCFLGVTIGSREKFTSFWVELEFWAELGNRKFLTIFLKEELEKFYALPSPIE